MKQTAVEWLVENILSIPLEEATNVAHLKKYVNKVEIFEQAKAKERSQKAEEYLKGFKDGKEHQIRLDELTFGSSKQIMSTDIPFTNKDIDEMMEILNRMQKKLTIKSE